MSGERDLGTLLNGLTLHHHEGAWAFVHQANNDFDGAIMTFQEREGWTGIVPADPETRAENRWVWLEVEIHSDLQAVGFLAAISNALADAGIPSNAVSAFYHDHLFVPVAKAEKALSALGDLQNRYQDMS